VANQQSNQRLFQNLNAETGSDPMLSDAVAQGLVSPDMEYARGGQVHSDAAQDRAQTLRLLKEKKLIKARGGRMSKFAHGGAEDLPPPAKKPTGKAGVLVRKPMGHAMPIPVLHTTIVIAAKPTKKKAAKKKGGAIKASALPPPKGPGNGDPPAPYRKGGHVQAPRGSGAAVRGKRFSGIY
jgi:hypothetical protein